VKRGRSTNGSREGTEEEKEGGSVSTPREVPSNFSAVVAPTCVTRASRQSARGDAVMRRRSLAASTTSVYLTALAGADTAALRLITVT